MNELVYRAIALLAEHLSEKCETMTFSELTDRLSGFFGENFCEGRGMARRVKAAYAHYDGYEDIQRAIADTFVNESGEHAYE